MPVVECVWWILIQIVPTVLGSTGETSPCFDLVVCPCAQAKGAFMPYLWGLAGGVDPNGDPRKWLSVTVYEYEKFKLWAEGNFSVGELIEYPLSSFNSGDAAINVPLNKQPAALDCATLSPAIGGAMHPGNVLTVNRVFVFSSFRLLFSLFFCISCVCFFNCVFSASPFFFSVLVVFRFDFLQFLSLSLFCSLFSLFSFLFFRFFSFVHIYESWYQHNSNKTSGLI